jgi:hypothetical protein
MNDKNWLNETRKAIEAAHDRPMSDDEVHAVFSLLEKVAGLLAADRLELERRRQILQRFPDGCRFTLAGYSCAICEHPAVQDEAWLDSYGLKCATCQANIDRGEVPPWLGGRRDDWYSGPELEALFRLRAPTIQQWCSRKWLRPRTIRTDEGKRHLQVFLLSEHKGFLPPKALLQPRLISVRSGEQVSWSLQPWYVATDPRLTLVGFRIKRYLDWL